MTGDIEALYRSLHERQRAKRPFRPADRVQIFRRVFGTDEGAIALRELALMAGVFETIPAAEGDALLHRAEGRRALIYDLWRDLTADVAEDGTVTYLHDHMRL